MKLISTSYVRFYRIFCMLFALHFFNLSIDSKDRDPDFVPEDLSFNDIESIAELIAEVFLGWEDAFQEHDENDIENKETVDFYKFYVSKKAGVNPATPIVVDSDSFALKNSVDVLEPHKDIHCPPPRV